MSTPVPPELQEALKHSRAQAFSHDIVMDALDLSVAFERHVLLYGLEGLFLLETDDASWRLPPSRIAWVPSGMEVRATTIRQVRCMSIFFSPDFAEDVSSELRVFGASPLVREMIKHARRWTVATRERDDEMERFFRTLLDVCRDDMREKGQLSLPKARSEELGRALSHTLEHLAEPLQLADVAKHAAMSPRTLMRRLNAEIHMTAFRKLTQLTPTEYRAQF